MTFHQGYFVLDGHDERNRRERLTFKRIETVPTFEEFEQKVLGTWEIYKSRIKDKMNRMQSTSLNISEEGTYAIVMNDEVVESGLAVINTRHRKVLFENEDTQWDAWFYGEELRLTNRQSGLQYDLRRIN